MKHTIRTVVPPSRQGPDAPGEPPHPAEPGTAAKDLAAFVGVLLLAGALLVVGALAHSGTERLAEWIAALIAAGFCTWLRIRRQPERKWTSTALSYTSPNGRFLLARSWGTEGHTAPQLPAAGEPQTPEPQP